MKKLLFVISQLYKGGAETSLVNLLNHLDYNKYSIELLILNQSPVKGAVSLIDRVNKNVTVCDAYAQYQKINIVDRFRAKLLYTLPQKGAYYFTALDFVRNKEYDWAFFVGEWYSPSFVADEVQARIKAAWIHNDLSDAEYFDAEHYFYFADMFDYFIFVSKNSLEASVAAYPFLKDKAVTIYNINDIEYIKKRADEPVDFIRKENRPVLLTCANFRPQKNHYRQIKTMIELKKRGIDFTWVNIGATTDANLVTKVKKLRDANGLTDSFLILGPKENPYSYIKQADAVAVFSDYESWSMVITEAKILGTPVISTKTSGALEQIEDGITGLLTDFTVQDMANKLERFFKEKGLQQRIRENISNFDNTKEILNAFETLIKNGKPSKEEADILYVIDDINYMGGAHIATKLQIKEFIKEGKKILIYSSVIPNIKVRQELSGVNFLSFRDFREDNIFNSRLVYCLTNKDLSKTEKKRKLSNTLKAYEKKLNYEEAVLPYIEKLFSKYNTVCVMSEGSVYRKAVSMSSCKNKIQWIHIDYCNWKDKSDWTRSITINDKEIYKKYNSIVVLTEEIKQSFTALYPHLAEKVVVNKNLIPIEDIKRKAKPVIYKNKICLKFVTVGRIDYQKAYPRLIKILAGLKEDGYLFSWTIIGGGEDFDNIQHLIQKSSLSKEIIMKGPLDNPFRELIKADVFALLSDFEGLPNTIYEALVLGIPVLATNVGGISTQIVDGENGWLVENNEKSIEKKLKYLMTNEELVFRLKNNLAGYVYDNQQVMEMNNKIFQI